MKWLLIVWLNYGPIAGPGMIVEAVPFYSEHVCTTAAANVERQLKRETGDELTEWTVLCCRPEQRECPER